MATLYESMYILDSALPPEALPEHLEAVSAYVRDAGGEVKENFVVQKRQLAYEIEDHTEGVYCLIYFEGGGDVVSELKHYFQITPEVLRGLVVVANEQAIWSGVQMGGTATAAEAEAEEEEEPAEEGAAEAEAAEAAPDEAEDAQAPAEAEETPEAEAPTEAEETPGTEAVEEAPEEAVEEAVEEAEPKAAEE